MKLDAKAFALSLGLLWACGVFVLALIDMLYGYGSEWVVLIGSVYKGYGPTLPGAATGLPWAFVDGFVGAWIWAWLYNKLAK
jgi:hypothetical protein